PASVGCGRQEDEGTVIARMPTMEHVPSQMPNDPNTPAPATPAQGPRPLAKRTAGRRRADQRPDRKTGQPAPRVLVVDVGGTHVKLLATGRREPVKLGSGPDL